MEEQAAAQQQAPVERRPEAVASSAARAVGVPTRGATAGDVRDSDVRLSKGEAEQIIRRALELQDAQAQPGVEPGLSLADVQDIAAQLGVDTALVRRASSEVRVARQQDSGPRGGARLLGPDRVTSARLVPADPGLVRSATARWMTHDEGMTRAGTRGDTDRWARDKRLLVRLRRGLQADRSSGVLRDLHGVQVAVSPDVEGAIVSIEADTGKIRNAGIGIAATGAAISAGLGFGAAAVMPDTALMGMDVLQFASVVVPSLAVTVGTTLAVTRSWTQKVRQGIEQALDGITMTTVSPDLPELPLARPDGWQQTVWRWLGGR